MRKFSVLLFVLCALGLLSAQTATKKATKAPNPWLGTWKLDVSQSKFPEGQAPKSETLHLTAAGKNGTAYTLRGVDAKGKPVNERYHSAGDGKEGSMVRGGKAAGKASYTLHDDDSVTGEGEESDGTKWTMKASLSDDHKTMTADFHFTPAQGSEFDQTEVYKK